MQAMYLHADTTVNRRDDSGRSGLELVLGAIAKILEPSQSEAGGLFVGDLVLHLIRKAGSALGPVLPNLLRAFVTRLATAQTSSFAQSLILPFAYLVHQQLDTVLDLLEGMTVPASGTSAARPALEVLLSSWCEHADVFQGFWQIKVRSVRVIVAQVQRYRQGTDGSTQIQLCRHVSTVPVSATISATDHCERRSAHHGCERQHHYDALASPTQ